MRILIAGFQHETNTFSSEKADYAAFERGGMYPAMARGADMFDLRDVNIPVGGFIQEMEREGVDLVPSIWAGATPSAHTTEAAYEMIAGEIVDAAGSGRFDAVYLDLHGAMVAEHLDDGEGELLRRLRDVVGPDVRIVASMDLHANVTERMFRNADGLVAYRTYPHEDMAITGERAARLLTTMLRLGRPLYGAYRRLPFLIPINTMCTLSEPARSLYAELCARESHGVDSLSFTLGFPAADFPECGGVVWGYGESPETVDRVVEDLFDNIVSRESDWKQRLLSPEDAVREAQRLAQDATRPVIIADTQDNPGGGANSDTTGVLRALIDCHAQDAAIGLIVDGAAARAAHIAGVGAEVALALGGRSGTPGDAPYRATFRVEQLSNGRCTFGGPMLTGKVTDVGPSARLSIGGVQIVVTTWKDQMIDRNQYRMVGIDPERMKILVNKSSVHFRADFEPIAEAILIAKSPGPLPADASDLPWTRLPDDLRVQPLGPTFGELRKQRTQ
jgi:microcystin degradation protein MlrC